MTSRLHEYGVPLASYTGEGQLVYPTLPPKKIRFEAGQFPDGETVIICTYRDIDPASLLLKVGENPIGFGGTTQEGWQIEARCGVQRINYLPDMVEEGAYDAFRVKELVVHISSDPAASAKESRFGLVNFNLIGTQLVTLLRQGQCWHCPAMPVQLPCGKETVQTLIISRAGADAAYRRVITMKSFGVLSELLIPRSAEVDEKTLEAAVSDLCLVLSVARGTKVQWIYREDWVDSTIVRISHQSRLTKRYCPLAPIGSHVDYREATIRFTSRALEVLPLRRDTFELHGGVVDAYLDAKAEHDFLETRGAKIAVAIEKLKDVFLKVPDAGVSEFIVNPVRFDEIIPKLHEAVLQVLRDAGLDVKKDSPIASEGRLIGLNRVAFRRVLKALCRYLDFEPDKKEIELFIASRNALVHQGRFYCDAATPDDRRKLPPLPDARREFFFLVSFMDRMFLKLLGYTGQFTDWRNFPDGKLMTEFK